MNINDKVNDLANAVKSTKEYLELKQAYSLINKKPDLKRKVEEIKKKQQEILLQYKPGQKELEPRILELNQEIKSILVFPEVNRYFTAGNEFSNMISKIFKTLNETLENDLKQ